MCILRFEVKQHVSALYGHHQVFSLKVTLYKLRCGDLPSDYSSSMPIYRRLLYYTDIYIYTGCHRRNRPNFGSVPYVKLYRYNPKHLYPKLNGYGDNGKKSLKL